MIASSTTSSTAIMTTATTSSSTTTTTTTTSAYARLSTNEANEAKYYAHAVASRYLHTLDPYSPHVHNIEGRLRHPVHVVTRQILYGNLQPPLANNDTTTNNDNNHHLHNNNNNIYNDPDDDLEALFNDEDDVIEMTKEKRNGGKGPIILSRRSAARMEAFLASCAVALRDEEEGHDGATTMKTTTTKILTTREMGSSHDTKRLGNSLSRREESIGKNKKIDKKTSSLLLDEDVKIMSIGDDDDEEEEEEEEEETMNNNNSTTTRRSRKNNLLRNSRSNNVHSSCKPKRYRQIDMGDLLLRLEIYCRTLRRIRCLSDADFLASRSSSRNNISSESTATTANLIIKECVIQWEPKKAIRSRIELIVQTFLRNVDCVRDVHTTLMTLVLRATLEVLAVEVWCPELRSTVQRLASEYEHKVSFASLAFLSSPDNSVETHLVPLLSKYFEYLQINWESLVCKCELERMLRTVLDPDLRQYFKNSVFRSVGHILDECRRERDSLDNISLPPPWEEGVLGVVSSCGGGIGGKRGHSVRKRKGGGGAGSVVDFAIKQYMSDPALVKQALRDLRREVITVNGIPLPLANNQMEFAEYLGKVLNSKQLELSLSSPKSVSTKTLKSNQRRVTNYSSDVGLEMEEESDYSGMDSDGSLSTMIDVDLVESLARRLLIAVSRTGSGGDAYFIVRDLFGGDEVEVVPHHSSSTRVDQGTIEIIVKLSSVIIKSHAKFDVFPKPVMNDSDALIQFHTTTTEHISLQQLRGASCITLKEKKTNMTGWRTLAIRPAYYERLPQLH